MTKHKCTWQLSEDGAAICLECTTIIGADGLIESLQTENTKLQEEIAALRAKVSEQEWEYASVVNQFHDAIKHNTALEKVAVRLYNLGYHSGHEDTVEGCYTHIYEADMDEYHDDIVADILREAGYLKEEG